MNGDLFFIQKHRIGGIVFTIILFLLKKLMYWPNLKPQRAGESASGKPLEIKPIRRSQPGIPDLNSVMNNRHYYPASQGRFELKSFSLSHLALFNYSFTVDYLLKRFPLSQRLPANPLLFGSQNSSQAHTSQLPKQGKTLQPLIQLDW